MVFVAVAKEQRYGRGDFNRMRKLLLLCNARIMRRFKYTAKGLLLLNLFRNLFWERKIDFRVFEIIPQRQEYLGAPNNDQK
ncbi:MAG: hypothetical protein GY821_02275 [Gammaproteobacteria bacterium]|nr:hypothetical protein [Gammaproteobacteria bacterium]